jgi:hypothetical protein
MVLVRIVLSGIENLLREDQILRKLQKEISNPSTNVLKLSETVKK